MPPAPPRLLLSALLLAAPLAAARPAAAQPEPRLGLELNRLEPRPELSPPGCRAWLVLRNPAGTALDPLRLDLVLFDRSGVIARRLALDVGPLPAGKTTVRIFDLAGQPCETIGVVLLNDLLACGTPDARADCLTRLDTASRVEGVRLDR